MPDAASTSVVSVGLIPGFERNEMCAGPAHALVFENSVVNGGALTQSQLDQINELYLCASIEFQTRSRRFLI